MTELIIGVPTFIAGTLLLGLLFEAIIGCKRCKKGSDR